MSNQYWLDDGIRNFWWDDGHQHDVFAGVIQASLWWIAQGHDLVGPVPDDKGIAEQLWAVKEGLA
jgi:hypothetical protein